MGSEMCIRDSNKINEQGILDSSTKKIFDDLNKSIQQFNANSKK